MPPAAVETASPAAVETAATADMRSTAATVEAAAATAMEAGPAARYIAAVSAATHISAVRASITASAVVAATAVAVIVTAAVTVAAAAITPTVEPRTGADENASDKVIGAVVAVGCASVRIIRVVAVRAGRSWSNIAGHRAYTDPYPHANLRARVTCGKQTHSKQSCQSEITHFLASLGSPSILRSTGLGELRGGWCRWSVPTAY